VKDVLSRFFRRTPPSKEDAKQRLKFLLIHDQVDLTPAQLEQMKIEIIEVINKYVETNPEETEFRLERSEDSVALVSSIPVQRVINRSLPAV